MIAPSLNWWLRNCPQSVSGPKSSPLLQSRRGGRSFGAVGAVSVLSPQARPPPLATLAHTDPATQIGPLVSGRQQSRVLEYIDVGQREGARLVLGGSDLPDGLNRGWYVQPTLFSGAGNDMRIARDEIFGPVLTVIPYDDEDQAVAIANDSEYGLAGAVFTAEQDRGLAVAARVRTGSFGVNEGYIMDPLAPYGGVKASATG